jgi:hypothetical protein
MRIDEGLQLGPLDQSLFIPAPTIAVNQVLIEGPVFVRALQIQSARLDRALDVQKQERLVERHTEF